MKVTILTVSFNRGDVIRGAMESVVSQDYDSIEYIVIDGGSTDNTGDEVRAVRKRVNAPEFKASHPGFSFRAVSEPDHGMYDALNKGLRMATGDIVGWVHSDDFLFDEHAVSDIVKAFGEEGVELVYANGVYVDSKNLNRVVRDWRGAPFLRRKVAAGWLPLHPTCFMRRDVIMQDVLYDTRYSIASDTEFLVHYLYEKDLKVKFLDRYVVKMRMGGRSTNGRSFWKMFREDIDVYDSLGMHGFLLKVLKMLWKVPQYVRPILNGHQLPRR